jgi:glc operon protein GlcG
MHLSGLVSKGLAALAFAAFAVSSQAQTPPPYGAPISLEQAKKVAAGASAEARKNNWNMSIVVTDGGGVPVYLERLDSTNYSTVENATRKAQTAAAYRRPSKAFQDAVTGGQVNFMALSSVMPLEGGLPIVIDGKVVGAIGVGGGSSAQDGQVAAAGVNALK